MGRVTDTLNAPIVGAEITLDLPTSRLGATSDSSGIFQVESPGGTGEYVLTVVALGYRPIRRRIGNDDGAAVLRANVTLRKATSTLSGIAVVAERPSPPKPFVYEIGVGGTEGVAEGTRAAAGPALSEFTDALRTNLFVDPQGFLALPSGESQTQLNGLLFRGTAMPRSTPLSIKAGVGEYDISAGGFSSGRVDVELMPAGEFARRTGELVLDAVGRQPGTQIRRGGGNATGIVDIGGTSRFSPNGAGISWGVRGGRSSAQNLSLALSDSDVLATLGLSTSVAEQIGEMARARGLWGGGDLRAFAPTSSATGTLRFDPTISRHGTNALILAGSVMETTPTLADPLAAPSRASGSRAGDLAAQHLFRRVDRSGAAWDVRSGVSGSRRTFGELSAPALATVFIRGRQGTDGEGGGAPTVTLGGAAPRVDTRRVTTEVVAQRDHFLGAGENRQRKYYAAVRSDWYARNEPSSATVALSSIAALRALDSGQVSVLDPTSGRSVAQRLSGGVSESVRLGPAVRVTAGARTDYQVLASRQDAGLRARSFDLSPRIGLTWNFLTPTEGPGFMSSNLQTRQLVPPGVLRVGAGVFVADYAPELGVLPGGFPASSTELTCALVGSGPAGGASEIDAGAFTVDALRDACSGAGGTAETRILAANASLSPAYRPSRSTRATASVLTRVGLFDLSADGIVAFNDRETGIQDLSVAAFPVSQMLQDGNRPFFADPTSINASDGRLPRGRLMNGRLVAGAMLLTSDRSTFLRRLALQASTRNGGTRYPFRIGYVLSRTDTKEGGWDRDTFGSPWVVDRAPSRFDVRHQVQLEVAHSIYGVSLSFWLRAASGLPFSVLVDGDVNGDGNAANDRALIPVASDAPTTPTERAMRDLIDGAPRYARECLTVHAGQDAGRGACRGPWSVRTAVYASVDPGVYFRRNLADVTIVVENPLSLLGDRLGVPWMRTVSSQSQVDPVLLRAVRFDQPTSAFAYEINSHFGQRTPSPGVAGGGYRISVSVRVPLSPGIQRQQLDRWLARNGVGQGIQADSLAYLFARNVPNLYDAVVDEEDELGLTSGQRSALLARRAALAGELSAIWRSLGLDLVESGARRGSEDALARVQRATDEAWEASRLSANTLKEVLTPVQQSLLPSPASALLHATEPVKFKIVYY